MNKRLFVLTVLLVGLCLNSCKDDNTLDRQTAEKVLREHPPKSLASRLYDGDQPTHQSTFADSARNNSSPNHEVVFLDGLVASGLLRRDPDVNDPVNGLIRETYEVIPQTGVKAYAPNTPMADAMFTLAQMKVKTVTGVSQTGTEATVTADLAWEPTDIYKRSIPNVRTSLDQCPPPSPDGRILTPRPHYCSNWLMDKDLAETKSVTFNFKKYDDGWRVVEE
ncbi:MAG: hypothetical protein M3O31_07460 [Acidobacteriota bacterium]|nr:hypothetical protein [Acidobacteriota bacterium]